MADNSYKDIAKTNTAFGGIRIFQILVNILKTKLFALFLGPAGIGIQSLLISTLNTLHQFTTFGVFKSAVRDISLSNATNYKERTNRIISVFHTLVLIFGIFGLIICAGFSSLLSRTVMGSADYTWAFIIISVALLFEAFTNGIISVFQGLRLVKKLALSSFIGAVVSLAAMIPLIVIWKEKSIPYAIVVSYLGILIVYCVSYYKNVDKRLFVFTKSKSDFKEIGIPIIKNGTLLMLSFCVHSLLALLTTSIIGRLEGVETVGFYSAANSCTYGNLVVFTSILTSDFYPRMSALQDDKEERNLVFNKQIEFFVLSLTPISCCFLLFTKLVVNILYSSDFYPIIEYTQIMAISLILKIVWQTCGATLMASGKNREYLFFDAIVGNGLFFLMNIIAFYFWGLLGMSYSFVVSSIIVMVILLIVSHKLTGIRLERTPMLLIIVSIISLVALYFCLNYLSGIYRNILSISLSGVIVSISFFLLNRRINIFSFFKRFIGK